MGSDAARTQRFYTDLFGWRADGSAFPRYATVDTGTGRGIPGGLGGGEESRWATIYAKVADADQTLSRAEKLGGARISDPGVPALKAAARAALYSRPGEPMKTGAFRDPAGQRHRISIPAHLRRKQRRHRRIHGISAAGAAPPGNQFRLVHVAP